MFTTELKLRIRFYETDKMGFMHHSNYARYYECARTESMRLFDYSYAQSEKDGVIMPVVKIESKFLKPLYYDDEVRIVTYIKTMPRFGMITFNHDFFNASNELVHQGSITLAMINTITNKRENGPKQLMDFLKTQFE